MGIVQNGISQHATFDAELLLEDGAAARTASGIGTIAGAARVIDFSPGVIGDGHVARVDFDWHLIVQQSDGSSGNETYNMSLQLSDDPAFSTSVTARTVSHQLGTAERYRMPLSNQYGDTNYKYGRMVHILGGTSPSITMLGYLAKKG